MLRRTRRGMGAALVALGALGIGADGLAAQTTGLPLRMMPIRTGVELAGDLGLARLTEGTEEQKVTAFAGSAFAGIGPVGIGATLVRATRSDDGPDVTAFTGMFGVRVLGGPLVPLSITWQGAVTVPLGTIDSVASGSSDRPWRGSLGLGAALTIPFPVLAITPWVGPRVDYFRRQPISGSRAKGAVAAGVDLGFLNGLVLRAAYDSRVGWEPADQAPAGVSFGVGYRFR
ncbi:MAG: hypothetical protein R2909_15875 [Gemmatimonadales bacterium]